MSERAPLLPYTVTPRPDEGTTSKTRSAAFAPVLCQSGRVSSDRSGRTRLRCVVIVVVSLMSFQVAQGFISLR